MATSLHRWLRRLEQRSPEARIELGLDRVRSVLDRLPRLPARPVITVAGTNGKGSVVAMMEAIARAAGLATVAYSSPHLLDFRERIRVNGDPVGAAELVAALDEVEAARGQVDLTYFEHVTLAALALAARAQPDLLLLEVGLGGRLDAVNVVDADVAVITSIGLDHQDWLGSTRLAIGREKAGIARAGRPLIVAERRLPRGMLEVLQASRARLCLAGRDFRWRAEAGARLRVTWSDRSVVLPRPALAGPWQAANAACAVTALRQLPDDCGLQEQHFARGLENVALPGRLQRVSSHPEVWLDVAHNGPAARALAQGLGPAVGRSTAVFGLLAGKDARAIGRALDRCFDRWLVAPLGGDRDRSGESLAQSLRDIPVTGRVEAVESVPVALKLALQDSAPEDRVVVFGSFRTVAAAWPELHQPDGR